MQKLVGVAFMPLSEDLEILMKKDLVKCWEKFKRDGNQMPACMAKTITTWSWFKVLTNEEGLKCLVKAKDDPKGLLACKSKATEEQTNNVTSLSEVLTYFVLKQLYAKIGENGAMLPSLLFCRRILKLCKSWLV